MSVTKKKTAKKKTAAKKTAVKKTKSAKRAKPVAKAARATRKSGGTYRPRLSEDAVIRVVASEPKPYREGSMAEAHFNAMKGGVTVGTYLKKFDKSTTDHRKARQWLWNIVHDENVKVLGA